MTRDRSYTLGGVTRPEPGARAGASGEYAMTNAVFVVITLAWRVVLDSWGIAGIGLVVELPLLRVRACPIVLP